jgi:hypothetical protein
MRTSVASGATSSTPLDAEARPPDAALGGAPSQSPVLRLRAVRLRLASCSVAAAATTVSAPARLLGDPLGPAHEARCARRTISLTAPGGDRPWTPAPAPCSTPTNRRACRPSGVEPKALPVSRAAALTRLGRWYAHGPTVAVECRPAGGPVWNGRTCVFAATATDAVLRGHRRLASTLRAGGRPPSQARRIRGDESAFAPCDAARRPAKRYFVGGETPPLSCARGRNRLKAGRRLSPPSSRHARLRRRCHPDCAQDRRWRAHQRHAGRRPGSTRFPWPRTRRIPSRPTCSDDATATNFTAGRDAPQSTSATLDGRGRAAHRAAGGRRLVIDRDAAHCRPSDRCVRLVDGSGLSSQTG